jgi:hypothetical protein
MRRNNCFDPYGANVDITVSCFMGGIYMSSKLNTISAVAIQVMVTFLIGCSAYHSLPVDWSKQIPGRYEGTHGNLKEVMIFEVGGAYTHQVLDGTNTVIAEGGSWSVPPGNYTIVLTPTESFTQFYDPLKRTFSLQGNPFMGYTYGPLPDGKVFSKISASTEFEFCLVRVTKSQADGEIISEDPPLP